jgi:ketosteroid isomerase-like protein
MKNNIVLYVLATLILFLASDQAAAQCKNGMCYSTPQTYSAPKVYNIFKGSEVSGTQGMSDLEKKIVQIEKDALDKWFQGDPSAYIEIMGDEIGYFDPTMEKRSDGRVPLAKMYEAMRGRVHAEKYEMLNTRIQSTADIALLTFNLIAIEEGVPYRWNCTEVFGLQKDGKWKIIHSHWSQTRPTIR